MTNRTNTMIRRMANDPEIVDCALGALIGMGGNAEITLLGMALYVLKSFSTASLNTSIHAWFKDIGVLIAGALLLVYWAYVDPNNLVTSVEPRFCNINSNEGLTLVETTKVICLTFFGIICNHMPIRKIRNIINGVSFGLLFYVVPTLLGSLAFQGFRGGGDRIFNIFDGTLSAQSTTVGYLLIFVIGIFSVLRKRPLVVMVSSFGIFAGIQTSNRSVLLFSIISSLILVADRLAIHRSPNILDLTKKSIIYLGSLAIALLVTIANGSTIYSRIISALEVRFYLYLVGYYSLIQYLLNPSTNLLVEVGSKQWWHSVPLDAARAGNLAGAYLALGWLAFMLIALIVAIKRKDLSTTLLAFACVFVYTTAMPLSAGSYELIALYCGYLLISNELFSSGESVPTSNLRCQAFKSNRRDPKKAEPQSNNIKSHPEKGEPCCDAK